MLSQADAFSPRARAHAHTHTHLKIFFKHFLLIIMSGTNVTQLQVTPLFYSVVSHNRQY
jgi:hypothetical protein